jgi:murein DD-endopeptidase MepM/ murein hydrolase activator NlpD
MPILTALSLSPPISPYEISSSTGYRLSPMGGATDTLHRGIDLVGPSRCPVRAAASGTVVELWPPPGGKFSGHPVFGGLIVLDHGNGLFTLYGHLSATYVHTGDAVEEGQIIGRQGSTGNSTGEHLHFEVIINPLLLFPSPLSPEDIDSKALLR